MAVFQIEDGIATGRGFSAIDANGVCAKFRDWVVKSPASGGPGWYIIADYSANVPVNFAPTDVNTTSNEITLTAHGYAHCHCVRFSTTTTAPGGLTNNTTYYVIFVNANTIKLATTFDNAMAGTAIDITTQGSGTHTISPMEYFIVVCDTNAPVVNAYNSGPGGNAPKYIRFGYWVSNAGYITIHGLLYWDTTNRRGRAYWTARELATYDAADFVYSFRGGAEQMMIATRTGTTWHFMIIDDFVGDTNLLEAATKVGVLQSGVSSGSSVVCQLAAGEALNFTANSYYFIYDFTATTTGAQATQVNYVKISSVDIINDRVTIETLTNNFNSGAVISPYAHRFYSKGVSRSVSYTSYSAFQLEYGSYTSIPYYSSDIGKQCYRSQAQGPIDCSYYYYGGSAADSYLSYVITKMAPDDRGNYAAQRPVIVETDNPPDGYNVNSSNRAYGIMKNAYVSAQGTAAAWNDYRVINSRNWLYVGQVSNVNTSWDMFILNTESLT